MQTFSVFKENFYQRITDPTVLDCEEFNLLKVVLDGLKVNYKEKGIYNQTIFNTGLKKNLIAVAKYLKYYRKIQKARQQCQLISKGLNVPYLFFDNGRVTDLENGNKVSFYFNKIEKYLGSENTTTIYQNRTLLKRGVNLEDLVFATLFNFYSAEEKKMIEQLKATYSRIVALKVFADDELFNIRVAINKFFDEYRLWTYILRYSNISVVFFDQHYHREGLILAMKRRKVNVVELQHGLIVPDDIFYVFPKPVKAVASRALFPDKIFTYGAYWSNILKHGYEFEHSQILVLGLYQELNTYVNSVQKRELDTFFDGKPFILVTTQTFLHDYFIEYITWLSNDLTANNSNIKIVVKNHPMEKEELYAKLKELTNVKLTDVNTEYLLSRCSWHLSCYSTTLYDAIRYGCRNYSLYIPRCEDYIHTLIKEGISVLVLKDQNPFIEEITYKDDKRLDKTILYDAFEQHKFKLKELI